MRVLIVHNRYRSELPSGENRVVDRDIEALADAGIEVRDYQRSSDEIDDFPLGRRAALAVRPAYSPTDTRRIDAILADFAPHVVHFHNPYPLLSPAFVRRAAGHGAKVVQTVHNYRHACPSGVLYRDGEVCRDCVGRSVAWPAVAHGCYRGSRPQSAVMAATLRLHRSTFRRVDLFVAVSDFTGRFLRDDLGVPADRVAVIPNGVADPGPAGERGTGFLFAGRLEELKGVELLLAAWEAAELPDRTQLTIAGDGPSRPAVEAATRRDETIRYLGPVERDEVGPLMEACSVVVAPSVWYEAMPMVIVEAFSRGRPVLGTDHGALGDLVDAGSGWLVAPTVDALAAGLTVAATTAGPDADGPRRRYEQRHRDHDGTRWLIERYEKLVDRG